jgi:hypothetical protein
MEISYRIVSLKELDKLPSLDLAALLRTASTILLIFGRFRFKPQGSLLSAWQVKESSKLPKQGNPCTS